MHFSRRAHKVSIRPLRASDRSAVAEIVRGVGNFNGAEIECALEIVDTYLRDDKQKDYRVVVAENSGCAVKAYVCWGPTPLTRGTYDLYWIATHPAAQGLGFGRALVAHVETLLVPHRIGDRRQQLGVIGTAEPANRIEVEPRGDAATNRQGSTPDGLLRRGLAWTTILLRNEPTDGKVTTD